MLAAPFAYGAGFGAYAPAAYGGYGWGAGPYGLGFFNQQHAHRGLGLQNLAATEMEELEPITAAIVISGCGLAVAATSAIHTMWNNARVYALSKENAARAKKAPARSVSHKCLPKGTKLTASSPTQAKQIVTDLLLRDPAFSHLTAAEIRKIVDRTPYTTNTAKKITRRNTHHIMI